MRPASVGFQCPNCVAEGAKATRSGRTAYGGRLSGNPALTSFVLIGINLAIFLLILATGWQRSVWIDRLALLPKGGLFRLPNGALVHILGVADGAWWQLFTSMFTQVELWHVGFNMLALYVLGPQLELALGRARFLTLYLLAGLGGSVLVYWLSPIHTPTVGASGALFGLMGALLMLAIKVRADYSQLLVWIGINFAITVVGRGFISWEGHLGGFLGGMLLAAMLAWAPRRRRTMWQSVGLGSFTVVLLVLIALRTAILN